MNGVGKQIRWSHFLDRRSGRAIIVPIDHGLSLGPVEGLASVGQMSRWIGHPAIMGIIAHKGMVERLGSSGLLKGFGVMIHLNGMMSLAAAPDRKEWLTTVEAALRLGADAVSVQLNFDGTNDAHNLTLLGGVVDEAQRCSMPVLTMLYDKVPSDGPERRLSRMRHLMRACVELGTDALKLAVPEQLSQLPTLLDGFLEHTAVFFAGGEVRSEEELLEMARKVVDCGATGLCVGRNIFQRKSVRSTLTRLQEVVLGSAPQPTDGWPRAAQAPVRWSPPVEEFK